MTRRLLPLATLSAFVLAAAPAGAFSTTGKYSIKVGPFKGKVGEKLKLSGRFTSKGTVSGVLATTFVLNGPKCTGKSAFTAGR
jgi:hypothetical protein